MGVIQTFQTLRTRRSRRSTCRMSPPYLVFLTWVRLVTKCQILLGIQIWWILIMRLLGSIMQPSNVSRSRPKKQVETRALKWQTENLQWTNMNRWDMTPHIWTSHTSLEIMKTIIIALKGCLRICSLLGGRVSSKRLSDMDNKGLKTKD